jgi:hypothetical protein
MCINKPVSCQYCSKRIDAEYMLPEHEKTCLEKPLYCVRCRRYIPYKFYKNHD